MILPRPPEDGRHAAAVAVGVAVGLALLAGAEPDLRFVDAVRFAERARALREGRWLTDGLYPVGYPALLSAAQAVTGEVLVAAKALAVLAGAGAAWAAARLLGAPAALWLVAQATFLGWAITEGTDLPAFALGLAALAAAAAGRSGLAGGLAAAACLCRYPAVAVLPAVLWLAPARGRVLVAFAVGTAPHWAIALATGASVLPQQELNLTIAAGRPTALWSVETLHRWPAGFGRATAAALGDPASWVGLAGLAVGLARRDRRAVALAGWALLHLALLGLAFANARLALPATLAVALGGAWLIGGRGLGLVAAAWCLRSVPEARAGDPSARAVAPAVAVAAALPTPCLTNNPWFHQRRDGWLVGGVQLSGVAPPGVTPAALVTLARERGVGCVALDVGRLRGRTPALDPLLREPVAGLTPAGEARGWRVYRVDGR